MAIATAEDALEKEKDLDERNRLSVNELGRLLELCLSSIYFSFKIEFCFSNISGIAMAASISVTTAHLTM